jgi:alkanesulfonate monooxygenase SsuD/methylene tetrahydromethanopterin reductase-like flavin-dependent oxidoreductase (luciferase family)
VALAAEIADGWFPIFFSPDHMGEFTAALAEGFARPGARRTAEDFEVIAFCPVVVDEDVERAADAFRPMLALYIGGMGAREMNFHFDVFVRMGFGAEAQKIQDLYLDGRKDEAAASVPTAMVENIALIGSRDKIAYELARWKESIATTLLVAGGVDTLRMMAELAP